MVGIDILRHLVAFFLTIANSPWWIFLQSLCTHYWPQGQFQATTSFSTTFKLMALIFLQIEKKKKKAHRQTRKAGEAYVACKTQSIYCLDFYRKYLSIPALWIPRNVILSQRVWTFWGFLLHSVNCPPETLRKVMLFSAVSLFVCHTSCLKDRWPESLALFPYSPWRCIIILHFTSLKNTLPICIWLSWFN